MLRFTFSTEVASLQRLQNDTFLSFI